MKRYAVRHLPVWPMLRRRAARSVVLLVALAMGTAVVQLLPNAPRFDASAWLVPTVVLALVWPAAVALAMSGERRALLSCVIEMDDEGLCRSQEGCAPLRIGRSEITRIEEWPSVLLPVAIAWTVAGWSLVRFVLPREIHRNTKTVVLLLVAYALLLPLLRFALPRLDTLVFDALGRKSF